MTEIVKLQVAPLPRLTSGGSVGILDIEAVDATLPNNPRRGIHSRPIQLGVGRSESIELPKGTYLASVRLPTGKILKELFTVESDMREQNVVLGSVPERKSSTKVHSLRAANYAATEVAESTRAFAAVQVPSLNFDNRFAASAPLTEFLSIPSIRSIAADNLLMQFTATVSSDSAGQALRRSIRSETVKERSLLPRDWDRTEIHSILGIPSESNILQRVGSSKNQLTVKVNYPAPKQGRDAANVHYAMLIEKGNDHVPRRIVGRLPGRWKSIRTQESTEIRIQVSRSPTARHSRAMKISVSDPDIQSVLGFIQQADLAGALAILDQCMDFLAHKSDNPYAAAAAGYVLLNAPKGSQRLPWENWIGNLGSWFGDLPDGKIQHATLLLQSAPGDLVYRLPTYFPRDPSSRAHLAAELLMSSLERGIPLYRAGLKLLASNLRIILNEPDQRGLVAGQLARALELVNWFLMRTDPQQVFTVLDLSDL